MGKNIIREFWDKYPCGMRHISLPNATKELFEANERERYILEPFIYKYAGFQNWKGKEVLEIGCGTGRDLIRFMHQGANVYGIDFSEKSVVLARERLRVFGFDTRHIIMGDAEALPFFGNQFDFVYSWGVLHHTPNIEKAISEMYRVLKPSGEICVMLYHQPSLVALQLYILFGLFAFRAFRSINEIVANNLESPGTKVYTKSQARQMFKNFKDLVIKTVITRYDLRYKRDKYKNDSFLPVWVGKVIPDFLGWFMIIKGRK